MSTAGETRVLIAMDGSKHADYAFDWYVANIHRPNDYVILYHSLEFHVVANMQAGSCDPWYDSPVPALGYGGSECSPLAVSPMGVGSSELLTIMFEEEKVHAEKYLEKLSEKMQAANLHGKVKQTNGPPRTEVLKVAQEENVSLIITGTRGMGSVRRTLLGSVSDHVLHHSHVPVLVCRHKDDHK